MSVRDKLVAYAETLRGEDVQPDTVDALGRMVFVLHTGDPDIDQFHMRLHDRVLKFVTEEDLLGAPMFAQKENVPPIAEELFWAVVLACPEGGTILELGSGTTTGEFAKYRNIISIENDIAWIGKHNKPENYIHCPIDPDGFYRDSFLENLPNNYQVLLIDGPCKENRADQFVTHAGYFRTDVHWFIDDTAYPAYKRGMANLEKMRGKPIIRFPRSLKEWGVILGY